jgi:ABC-2 type transport system ATP-binding protein
VAVTLSLGEELRSIVGSLLVILLGFILLTGWALESGGVAVLETETADGTVRSTHIWYAEPDGELWVEAGTPENGWYLDIQKDPLKAKAQFAYVPDTPNLYGKLKASEYLRFMARLYHVPTEQADARMKQLLDLFELTDKAGAYLESFSHGMQQKIAITGALLHDPKVLFMDEPTVGLDPRSARLVKDLIQQRRDEGNAVFFSTHILEIAQSMCDRVIIIDKGKILADAPVDDLRQMKGDQSLEDIFLELTGGNDVDEMVKELGDGEDASEGVGQ